MKSLKLEQLAHTCMVALAAASTANIGKWLHSTGENFVTAWGVAIAVGAMVVTLSIILSRIDRRRSREMFVIMTVAAGAMCLLSGTLQALAYDAHMELWKALLLGYSLPLAGELLVGVAMSMYASYQEESILLDADGQADRQIQHLVAKAMGQIDLSGSMDYMQRKAETLARRKIDATVARLMAQQGPEESQPESTQVAPNTAESPKLSSDAEQETEQNAAQPNSIERANAARKEQIEQRRRQLAHLLTQNPDVQTGELSDKLSVSPNTIRSDKRAIQDEPHLYLNGSAAAYA